MRPDRHSEPHILMPIYVWMRGAAPTRASAGDGLPELHPGLALKKQTGGDIARRPCRIEHTYCLTHTVVIGSFVLAGVPTSVNFFPSADKVIVLW